MGCWVLGLTALETHSEDDAKPEVWDDILILSGLVPPLPTAYISNSSHQEIKAATFLGHVTGTVVWHGK